MSEELLGRLPRADQQYLAQLNRAYELKDEGSDILLIFKDTPIGSQYTPAVVDLLIKIPSGYPDVAPDMFWVKPHVRLANTGQTPQAADVTQVLAGDSWQRWSRHMNNSPWRHGVDNVRTFMRSIHTELVGGR